MAKSFSKVLHRCFPIVLFLALFNICFYYFLSLRGDIKFGLIWWIFFCWIFCLLLSIVVGWLEISRRFKSSLKGVILLDWRYLVFIIFLAAGLRFAYFSGLDFVLVGDSLREVGFNSLSLLSGKFFDPFRMGSYSGYGNLVPFIGGISVKLWGTSALAVRLPAAILSILTIFFLYLFLRIWRNRKTALFASLLLSLSLRYLYYSRSEMVIVSPGLFLVLFLLLVLSIKRGQGGWLLLGLMMGLSCHFYVATRPIVLLVGSFLVLATRFLEGKKNLGFLVKRIIKLVFGFVIGLGPAICYFSHQATGAGAWIGRQPVFTTLDLFGKIKFLSLEYFKAVANNFFLPTSPVYFHYPVTSPLLEWPLNALTIMALLIILVKKVRGFLYSLMLVLLFGLPLFLQVFSSDIGQDQRNLANLILGAIFSGVALDWLVGVRLVCRRLKYRYLPLVIVGLILLCNLAKTVDSYYLDKVSYRVFSDDQAHFPLQQIANHIYQNKRLYQDKEAGIIVVYNQPELLHIREKLAFYAFPLEVDLVHFLKCERYYSACARPVVVYFVDDYGLSLEGMVENKTVCSKTILPRYDCPLGDAGYSFWVSERLD
jgi:hypothetical protein